MIKYNTKGIKFYSGIDLHKKKSYIYVIDENGERVEAAEIETSKGNFERFFSPYPPQEMLVAVEISSLTFSICDAFRKMGISVYVVNVLENSYLSRSMKKTDKEDARKLAIQLWKDILPLPVYIPAKEEREVRRVISHRHFLVKESTRVINRTSQLLANHEIKCSKRSLTTRKKWQQLLDCFKSGFLPNQRVDDTDNCVDDLLLEEFTTLHSQFLLLHGQIAQSEKLLTAKLQATPRFHNMHENLLTIPGVGLIVSGALIGCLGDAERFKSAREMISYIGLCPKVRESGGRSLPGGGGITKRGNSRLRGYFTQAALGALSSRQLGAKPLKDWYERLRRKKGWRSARVALARKLAQIAFGVIKNNQPYDPLKVIDCCKRETTDANEKAGGLENVK